MGSYDRDYARKEMRQRLFPPLTQVTKWLLIANLVVFLLDALVLNGGLTRWGAYRVGTALGQWELWQFVTFQFLHGGPVHLLLNSLGLYFLGPTVERWWGGRPYLFFYLACGAAGALLFTLLLSLNLLPKDSMLSPLVGASAGVFGMIFALMVLMPDREFRLLFPPITLKVRQIALILAGISVATILGGLLFPRVGLFNNEGGQASHLGGALMGLLLMKFPWLMGKGSRPGRKVIRPKEFRGRRSAPKIRPRSDVNVEQVDEVDRILDKINAEGVGSLSEEEKAVLESVNKKKS